MSVVRQLPPHVADLIAAGEVVERPASVVKELLENAVDAGAGHITVELKNGGMTFLRVSDDGCGMDAADAKTAFLRHATSKLHAPEDLSAIQTLGFRGEALAAIASVSRIDLLTRTAGDTAGTSLRLEGGSVLEQSPAGCPPGTTIIVRDLFFNTPARMKFMKSDAAEAAQVLNAVQNQALCHPDIAFRCLRDGQEQLSTPGDGSLRSAVYTVLGREFSKDLTEVDSHWEDYTLRGFVTKPEATRGNRLAQRFFAAGRPVKSKLLTAALERAYENQLLAGRFPGCVLMLELPPRLVDVNVHPAKTEVRFLSEQDVFDAVRYGVQGALNRAPGRPEMKLNPRSGPHPNPSAPKRNFYQTMDTEQFRKFADTLAQAPAAPPQVVKRIFAPPSKPSEVTLSSPPAVMRSEPPVPKETPMRNASGADAPPPEPPPASQPPEPVQQNLPLPAVPSYHVVGEVLNTYIIVEQEDRILLLDKHAAHERILFEKFRAAREPPAGQLLLSPLPVRLGREEAGAVLENAALLFDFGFEAEDFGGGQVVLRQIPADLDLSQAETVLQELAAQLLEGRRTGPETLRDNLLHTIACKAAIKAGWYTDPRERDELVAQVLSRDDIKYCPHGRPVCMTLTRSQLERQFRRS